MAVVNIEDKLFTINAANAFYLTKVDRQTTGTLAIHLQSSSFVGSITVKARVFPDFSNTPTPPTVTPVAWSYLSYYLNGAATAGVLSTAITGTSVILVPASGLQIVLDCTAYTSGTMQVTVEPCVGAAA